MLTKSTPTGNTEIHIMDWKQGGIWRFTIDEIDGDKLPPALVEYINGILPDIKDGRWHYGTFTIRK
ncbi:hypothetical protein [Metabacillus sp. RGM 3146]|uniref:hypothetical protein n=1 Tax=Metabacillus sp. RGM 3146 TaxID=3401092 RepID=UPI003B9BE756